MLNVGQLHIVYSGADPAAEDFVYQPTGDVRDLISVDDAMEELHYGPNGYQIPFRCLIVPV